MEEVEEVEEVEDRGESYTRAELRKVSVIFFLLCFCLLSWFWDS